MPENQPTEIQPGVSGCDCCGSLARLFPNCVVYTHEGRRTLFYKDLLLGRTVLINLMSIANDRIYPVTRNFAKVQDYLGDRLGRDVFMYSITVDPERDTPRALGAFRKRYGAREGWTFLTGTPLAIGQIHGRLFTHGPGSRGAGGHDHHARGKKDGERDDPDCSLGLIRYGNESVGIWGAVPTKTDPVWIAQRIDWITPKPQDPAGGSKRRGPAPLAKQSAVDARIYSRQS